METEGTGVVNGATLVVELEGTGVVDEATLVVELEGTGSGVVEKVTLVACCTVVPEDVVTWTVSVVVYCVPSTVLVATVSLVLASFAFTVVIFPSLNTIPTAHINKTYEYSIFCSLAL